MSAASSVCRIAHSCRNTGVLKVSLRVTHAYQEVLLLGLGSLVLITRSELGAVRVPRAGHSITPYTRWGQLDVEERGHPLYSSRERFRT